MQKNRILDTVVTGHICIDIIPSFPKLAAKTMGQIFVPGTLVKIGKAAISTGGPVSNTGLALKKLGINVALIAKVADDFFGNATIELLKQSGMEKGIHKVKPGDEVSSYTIALAPPGFDRMFLHNPGTNNTFGYADIDFELVRQAKLFHLGYPPAMRKMYADNGKEMVKIFKKVKQLGVTTSLDMSLPDPESESGKADWNKILKNTLPYIDIFLPSVEETLFMLDKPKYLQIKKQAKGQQMLDSIPAELYSWLAEKCLEYGAKIVGLKCAHKGFYLRTSDEQTLSKIGFAKPNNLKTWANRELWEPSFHVEPIASATGSGDSAIAGFLAAYLRGKTIEVTLRYACAVGGDNLYALDALSSIRNWQETTRQIQSGWKKNKLIIKTAGWKYDNRNQLWYGPNDRTS
ncbi:MAG: carbohydrate kinase family protein [bacterium]|nr:carbohydrate kinase family protein [bacterium]